MPFERIFVLEDDLIVRKNIEAQLRTLHYEVVTAATLASAQAELANSSFDLIIADVRLPDGSGADLLRQLQARPQKPLVIMMSGFGGVEHQVLQHAKHLLAIGRRLERRRQRRDQPEPILARTLDQRRQLLDQSGERERAALRRRHEDRRAYFVAACQDISEGNSALSSSALQLRFLDAERKSIAELYARGEIGDDARRRIEREMDLEDSRLRHAAQSGVTRAL